MLNSKEFKVSYESVTISLFYPQREVLSSQPLSQGSEVQHPHLAVPASQDQRAKVSPVDQGRMLKNLTRLRPKNSTITATPASPITAARRVLRVLEERIRTLPQPAVMKRSRSIILVPITPATIPTTPNNITTNTIIIHNSKATAINTTIFTKAVSNKRRQHPPLLQRTSQSSQLRRRRMSQFPCDRPSFIEVNTSWFVLLCTNVH